MSDFIHVYRFKDFKVQSPFDERTTLRLFEFILKNKIMGRTTPPRKGFLGMAGKMLWRKRFKFEGTLYVAEGGGKEIAIYEYVDAGELARTEEGYRECFICGIRHPDSDLVDVKQGCVCRPCYEARFPACVRCGRRVELPEDAIADESPFLCDSCAHEQ